MMKETICTVAGLVGGFIATLLPTSYPMSAYHSPSNSILPRIRASARTISVIPCASALHKRLPAFVSLTGHLLNLLPERAALHRGEYVVNGNPVSTRKMCPLYILPHWAAFKAKVQAYLTEGQIYCVRTSWDDVKSQTGAFKSLDNAKKSCKAGYSVFDENGTSVFTAEKAHKKGDKVTLKNAVLYASSTAKSGVKKTGTFYLYDGMEVNGRYRITTKSAFCGKNPIGKYVTGWVEKNDV